MKLFLLLLVCVIMPAVYAVENPWDKKLPFESGLIVYELGGSMSGKKALYIEDYGKKTAEYSKVTVKMMGMTNTESTTTITTPDWVYEIDNKSKTGTKQANPDKFFINEFEKLSDADKETVAKNAEEMGNMTAQGLQGDIHKNAATILGYKCDKISVMGTTMYMIAGSEIPLKVKGNAMGIKISEVAKKIHKGSPPAKAFNISKKIKFYNDKSEDRMMAEEARTTIQDLLYGNMNVVMSDNDDFPDFSEFDPDMSDEEAMEMRATRIEDEYEYNDDDDDESNEITEKDIEQGLKKVFKGLF